MMNPVEERNLLEFELSEDDKKRIDEITAGIDLDSAAAVLQYGASCQQKIEAFSDSVLDNVREKGLGKASRLVSELAEELKSISSGGKKRRREHTESKLDTVTAMLYDCQNLLLEESVRLKKMYRENENYYKELSLHILAGKKKLELDNDGQMRANFEKKLHDLEVSKMVCLQMAAQLEVIQRNNVTVSDNIQAVLKNTVPLWRTRIITAEGIDEAGDNNKQLLSVLDNLSGTE